jgi:hypothetical protein
VALDLKSITDVLRACEMRHHYIGHSEAHDQEIIASLPKNIETHYTVSNMETHTVGEWKTVISVVAQRRGEKLMRKILSYSPGGAIHKDAKYAFRSALYAKNMACIPHLLSLNSVDKSKQKKSSADEMLHDYIRSCASEIRDVLSGVMISRGSANDAALALNKDLDHQIVKLLILSAGANPNAKNQDGETPLTLAFKRGATWLVETLLVHGASTLVDGPSAKKILAYAQETGDPKLMRVIEDTRSAEVQKIITAGADILAAEITLVKKNVMKLKL